MILMKKFKIRFSYFLILGIIGIIFQIISFFSWKNGDVSQALLITSSTAEHFDLYIKQNYFVIVSCVFMICFAVGLVICSKGKQLLTKIGGYTLGVSQLLVLVVTIVYISYATKYRTTLFKEEEQIKMISNLVSLKYTGLLLTYIGLAVTSLGLVIYKKEEKFTKAGGYVGLVFNGLLVIGLLTVLVGGSFSQTYEVTNCFIDLGKNLKDPYELLHGSMNGFTFTHLKRLLILFDEIALGVRPEAFRALQSSVVISIITLVINAITILGNLVFLSLVTIQSFDVDKDNKPLEI